MGVDIGGTKVEAALVDARGRVVVSSQRPQGIQLTPVGLVEDLAQCLEQLGAAVPGKDIGAVGMGVAGQIDSATGTVHHSPNLAEWNRVPLRREVERILKLPTFVINDVQAATWAEWRLGAGKGVRDLVCIFVGTGIGGGVVAGGRMLTGASGAAGELGHTTLDYRGPPCRCGGRGCLEAHAGGWAIALRAQEGVVAEPEATRTILALAEGVPKGITAATVARAAHSGDPWAQRLVAEVGQALGAGVASAVNAFNPRRVILGGGVIQGMPELVDTVREAVQSRALPSLRTSVEVVVSHLGPHAAAIGAGLLARRRAALTV